MKPKQQINLPYTGLLKVLMMVPLFIQLTACVTWPWERSKFAGKPVEKQMQIAKKDIEKKPDGIVPRKNLLVTEELAVTRYMLAADKALAERNYQEANDLYDKILTFLPDSQIALNGKAAVERAMSNDTLVNEAATLLDNRNASAAESIVHHVLLQNPNHADALDLQKKIKSVAGPASVGPPSIKPPYQKPVTLELRDANIKVVFEALSRVSGINFILDKDIKPNTKATIFVKKAKIEDAIELVLSSNGLQQKVLTENTVLIYPNTKKKLSAYQDLVIRNFYLSNTSAKQVASLLKTMLKTKDIFVDERLNMIAIRDTPEAVRIAEKLIAANDLEDPEVMLEVEILEVNRSRFQELGLEYPTSLTVLTTPLTLRSLRDGISSDEVGVSPNPKLNFSKTVGDVNVLSNPRIRVKNNEKAKVLIGDKIPIITSTAAVNAGVAESVNYIDVGLTLEVEPRITVDDFVNINLALEVSSLGEQTTSPNGTVAFTIGTRSTNTILRLKNNETQVLAGLISDTERRNASRVPGIGDLPILGRLFANQKDTKRKTEVVLAITPRIISNITRPEAELTEYWSGTENLVTDRQKITLPPDNGTSSRRGGVLERVRQRNQQRPTSVAPSQPEITSIETPAITPQQNTELPINAPVSDNVLKPLTTSPETTPDITPANPNVSPQSSPSTSSPSSGLIRPKGLSDEAWNAGQTALQTGDID